MATYPNVDQASLDAMALHDVLIYPANNGGDVWYQGVITRVSTGWLYGHEFVPETVCCTGSDSFFFYDQIGSDAPVAPSTPTTIPSVIADGALVIEQWDNLARYWTYDASGPTWTLAYDNVSSGISSVSTDATLTGNGTPGSPLSVDKTGDWTGTFDGQDGSYYLDYTNFVNTPSMPTVDDTAYGPTWNGNTDAPTKNAVYDKLSSLSSTDITNFTEASQDAAGAMVSGNTETLIAVTYDDPSNKLNFAVEPNLSNYTNDIGFLTDVVQDLTPQLGGDLDAQNNEITNIDGLSFNLTPVTTGGTGEIWWNPDEETFNIGVNSDVELQVGQENLIYIKADEDISNGEVVMYTGAVGASGKPTGALSDGFTHDSYILGIATEDILTGNFGFVTKFGKVRGIQTDGANYGETWNHGDEIWDDPSTPGALTNVKPTAPNHAVLIGFVIVVHASNGTIFVNVDHKDDLENLHDVNISGKTAGDSLVWDSVSGTWVSQKICDSNLCADLSSYTGLDNRYYTESEVDSLLSGKANTSHTHTTSDITDLAAYTGFDARYYTESEVDALTWTASDIVSGTFADARISESSVTQHRNAIRKIESFNTVATTTYTLVLGDAYDQINFTNASGCAITIPPNSSVAFDVGTIIDLCQRASGDVGRINVSPGSGVTIVNSSINSSNEQYDVIQIRKEATDTWLVVGGINPSV